MKYLDLTGLGEVWANIKSYISSKIPTKTSQLQNDSNYVTTSQLPSKTSQLTNDSDFTTNAKLATKQDTISDLATIRSGASKGATAVQPSDLTSKANDSDVVHKSGNEFIHGVKNFNDVVLGEQSGVIRIGNNGEGALFCKFYYDGQIYNNSKQFIPTENNEYNLGTPTNKWKDVYATTFNGKIPAYADDLTLKANIADTVLKTSTAYTFCTHGINSLNIDEKFNENYIVAISEDGHGTRPVGGWTNIINFTSNHFITQLCNQIYDNYMYVRSRWSGDMPWSEWVKLAKDSEVVKLSGDETINGQKKFNTEIVNISVHAFRHVYGDYGVFWRHDNANLYLLLTNSGDQYGGWNNFRPLTVNLATGICSINGNADTVDGSHAWQMQTLSAGGNTHGSGQWLMQCQHNVDGDNLFKLYVGDKSIGTKVDRANSAGYADYATRLETINGAPIIANGKNIVRSVNGVNADNNGNVTISGFSNGIGEIIQGYYVPNGVVQKSGSVYFGTLVQPNPEATLNDFRDINITITNEFYPEAGKIYDYSQIFSTLYLHSYDSEYAVGATFDGDSPKIDKWFGGWIKVAGSNLVRNSGKYLCTSVSPYGYAVTLRYNLTMTCTMISFPGGSRPKYTCKIVSKTVPQNQMTVTSKATFMRVG